MVHWNTNVQVAGIIVSVIYLTRHVLVKHGCTQQQQSQNMTKICKSYILTRLPHLQGQWMSAKCEKLIDELTVQVWLLYHHPNFKYCTFLKAGRNYGQTNGRSDYYRDVENFFSMSDIRSDKLRKFVRPNENMPDRIYILHNSTPFFRNITKYLAWCSIT